ncbi:hypothetical protein F2Q70_00019109 [Brassica cretica]|uniref:Uncharacterized protein n=1 Tax=Brassica cretica TaxID=69181 RepID=A0A8S9GUE8_BRACR|nr:hypothetical protein F2Q70_00019109 [Brassica cretica]
MMFKESVNSGWGDAARLDVEMSAMVKVFTLKNWMLSFEFDSLFGLKILPTSSTTNWGKYFVLLTLRTPSIKHVLKHHGFDYCQVVLVPEGVNSLAFEIAASVTTGLRYQSYIANGGPSWLSPAIRNQALP